MTYTADIKRQFFNSLKRGTGEAYLIAKNNPTIDFSNQIIKGALNIFAYDGQCEGNRAQYIYDIISVSKKKDKIRKAILQGLATEKNDTWNLTHLFALAKLFAERNDTEAKRAIYDRFLTNPIEGSDWVGAYEILELDGLNGLFYVAEKFGKHIEQNPDDWQDDWIITHFQEENKSIKVYEELKKKAKTNKFIRIYLDNIKRTKSSQKRHKTKPTKYKDIIDEVINSKPRISFVRKRKLFHEEVNQVAKQLINEADKVNIEKLLDIFDFYKFPYDNQIILDFAKQKRTSKNRIVENAVEALKHLKSKDIRDFAIDKIKNSKNPIDFLEILTSNYKSGDFKLLSEIADNTNNEHKIEQLAGTYTDIFKANQTKECKQPLEILYNKMNCAIHRKGIVEILIKNKVLSDKIKSEILFDSDLETRNLTK
ncbi:MAG: hypothetical protein IT272_09220 [Chitinophagales bacterium]|jgi:hypothetical protein|nr:hypothetical protein [Sphingobacteriales bacterium]MBK6890303.1 hypothetical protein [Sphingobacteriales bacterium]MBK8678492.1 hypothetical protein [Sphingobacteriales bacterium]MCC7057584.1 hypothetical protein [Chitinophagales bacterium]MDA0197508.1 hypothetical protein [Bacteroidota bacterium]